MNKEKQILAAFKHQLHSMETLEDFLIKTSSFKTFFDLIKTGTDLTECEILKDEQVLACTEHAIESVSNLDKAVAKAFNTTIAQASTQKDDTIFNIATLLAVYVNEGNLELYEEIVEAMGDYYTTTFAFGLSYKGKELEDYSILEEAQMDLTGALGEVYSIIYDKRMELELSADYQFDDMEAERD